jgi:hypothetical protein
MTASLKFCLSKKKNRLVIDLTDAPPVLPMTEPNREPNDDAR